MDMRSEEIPKSILQGKSGIDLQITQSPESMRDFYYFFSINDTTEKNIIINDIFLCETKIQEVGRNMNLLRDIISKIERNILIYSAKLKDTKNYKFFIEENIVYHLFTMNMEYFIPKIFRYIINKKIKKSILLNYNDTLVGDIIDKIIKMFDMCIESTITLNENYKIYISDPTNEIKTFYLSNIDIFSDFIIIELNITDIHGLTEKEIETLLQNEHDQIIVQNIMSYKIYYNFCVDLIREKKHTYIKNWDKLLKTNEYKASCREKISQYEERIKIEYGKSELFKKKKRNVTNKSESFR